MSRSGISSEEFEARFDVLYNNVTSNQAPGLNTYEKCVFLTKAEDEVIKNYFTANSRGNNIGQGFDDSAKRQIDFSVLTTCTTVDDVSSPALFDTRNNSASIELPSGIMMIINETVRVIRNDSTTDLVVVPLRFDEYSRLMSKPFKRPVKNQAWRLINSSMANRADIIVGPKDTISSYIVRFIRTPKPIIIGPLDGLTINGYCFTGDGVSGAEETEGCELDPILHEEILQRAVELAKIAWTQTGQDNIQAVLQAGQRSE